MLNAIMSREVLIRDARKIDMSSFIKKNDDFSLSIKSKKLDELYEKYRITLEKGDSSLIAKARRKLIEYKCKLGCGGVESTGNR